MIVVYPAFALIWLVLAACWFYWPLRGIIGGEYAPFGALLLSGYNLVRFGLAVRANRPQRVHHDTALPEKPVVAPEFDFDDHDEKYK